MTSSPESFYYAVEGYYSKQEEHARLVRIQTYYIITSFGAKLKNGGDISLTDIWKLPGDNEEEDATVPSWAATSIEFRNEIIKRYKGE